MSGFRSRRLGETSLDVQVGIGETDEVCGVASLKTHKPNPYRCVPVPGSRLVFRIRSSQLMFPYLDQVLLGILNGETIKTKILFKFFKSFRDLVNKSLTSNTR